MNNKKYLILVLIPLCFSIVKAQTTLKDSLVITGSLTLNGGDVYLVNSSFVNNGLFIAIDGKVHVEGDDPTAKIAIKGTSPSTFHGLRVNSLLPHVYLEQDIAISETLELEYGLLDNGDFDVTILGDITNFSEESYFWTSGSGRILRDVLITTPDVVFPVGVGTLQNPDPVTGESVLFTSFNPARITNTGALDRFAVRFNDEVLTEGTSGDVVTESTVDGTWYIDEAVAGGSSLTLNLSWNDTNEMTGFDRNACFISHYENGEWDSYTASSVGAGNPISLSRSGITTLSPFTVTSDVNALPLDLLSFEAKQVERTVLLDWESSNEVNVDYFDIERSSNGLRFSSIGKLDSKGQADLNVYEFIDNKPFSGKNYYRLKIVDTDGSYQYSPLRLIDFELDGKQFGDIYPNPSQSGKAAIEIDFNKPTKLKIEVFDMLGRLLDVRLRQMPQGISILDIDLSKKGAKVYLFKFTMDNQQVVHRYFMVTK